MIELNKRIPHTVKKFIWINGERLGVLEDYRIVDFFPEGAEGGFVDPWDKDYFLCIKSDYTLVLIDCEKDTFYEDTEEVRKGMEELNKRKEELKQFEIDLSVKLLGDYHF